MEVVPSHNFDPALPGSTPPHRTTSGRRRGEARARAVPIDSEQEVEILREVELAGHAVPARAVVHEIEPRVRSERVSRVVNVLLAAVAILVTAPLMLLVALAVKLTSPGPVMYTQDRVGLDRRRGRTRALHERRGTDHGGQLFTIYKFRSMYVDAENGRGAVWATRNDPRVTPVGRVLRSLRLDELPQLINVLKGDMNIVGPRPERPCIFAKLREDIAEYPLRQRTKPGITGWAQINHTYDTCVDDVRTKVRYDLEYLARQSLWEDLKIMIRTIPVMLFKKSGW